MRIALDHSFVAFSICQNWLKIQWVKCFLNTAIATIQTTFFFPAVNPMVFSLKFLNPHLLGWLTVPFLWFLPCFKILSHFTFFNFYSSRFSTRLKTFFFIFAFCNFPFSLEGEVLYIGGLLLMVLCISPSIKLYFK